MIKPKIAVDNLTVGSFSQLYDNEDFLLTYLKVEKEVIEEQSIDQARLTACLFEHVIFQSCDFSRLEISDCIFIN